MSKIEYTGRDRVGERRKHSCLERKKWQQGIKINRFVLKEEFKPEALGLNGKLLDNLSQDYGQKVILVILGWYFYNIRSSHRTSINSLIQSGIIWIPVGSWKQSSVFSN